MKKDNNNEQIDVNVKSDKPNVLRAKDIVPPYGNDPPKKEQGGEIPQFDLAEQIMAEQRKISAIKRKSPNKKIETVSKEGWPELTDNTAERPSEASSEQEQIIAEIVARDIQQFCRRTAPV